MTTAQSCVCPVCLANRDKPEAIALVANPTPREKAEGFASRFRRVANGYALTYGGPLYLVGSMLTSDKPGDIDIRVMIERADIEALFGENVEGIPEWSPATYAKAREELKQSRRLTRRWCRIGKDWGTRIDFQFQISLMSDITGLPVMRDDKPSLRLDDVPLAYFEAGRGEP